MTQRPIVDRLKRLMSKMSESNTENEKAFSDFLLSEIAQFNYFKNNPTHFGSFDLVDDSLDRKGVWAFSYKGHSKTLVFLSHYDVAYSSKDLPKEEDSDHWIFGRGASDMKAGLAVHLHLLENHENGANILLLSVPDQEGFSEGMIQALPFLEEIKKRFAITFELVIASEPHERKDTDLFKIHAGSVGKMHPFIFVKGTPVHSACPFTGLNAIALMMEIIKAVDQNTEMSDRISNQMTPPPTFLTMKDLKKHYDITTPEYAVGLFNWLFLKDDLHQKFEQLKELCVWSAEDAVNQYNYSYNEYLKKQKLPSYRECHEIDVKVMFYGELLSLAKEQGVEPLEDANGPEGIKDLLEKMAFEQPLVVIGLMPPFYPPINNQMFLDEKLSALLELWENEVVIEPYYMQVSDLSYFSKVSQSMTNMLEHMPFKSEKYLKTFEKTERLNIPVINIGPRSKGMHTSRECVWTQDVEATLPKLIGDLVEFFGS